MESIFAHSASAGGEWHSLKNHLTSVAGLAGEFAAAFGARNEAYLAGLLHDLGKYGDLFQKRLVDPRRYQGIDHWTPGAWAVYSRYPRLAVAASLAAAGHHLGLPPLDRDVLANLDPAKYSDPKRTLSEKDLEVLLTRQRVDGLERPASSDFVGEITGAGLIEPAAAMLDYRMLFSALVDADFLDTEAHFNRGPDGVKRLRKAGPAIDAAHVLEALLAHITGLAASSTSDQAVNRLRADLLAACLAAAETPPGQFTLSAPTGSGKTLAMLAFAMKHAASHGLRRVVVVIPYLTIIEQTMAVYRHALAGRLPPGVNLEYYLLEHHSLAGRDAEAEADDAGDPVEPRRRELAQNWDAPIVVTTSVQMLHSLFANRPGACRKLHRLAKSVVLFDEVQTLPTHLAAATIATLGRLCERFGATVVFSTATQPAFDALQEKVRTMGGLTWEPREIAPEGLGLFRRVRRTRVAWPEPDEALGLEEVAALLAGEDNRRSLCVVNMKRQARGILRIMKERGAAGLFHLSTDMCPAHREAVLGRVRARLSDPAAPPVRLVSTQCVEAGVDLDFPVVWRAWGPLTAIAQAAGRCNRNGNLTSGLVRVFRLREIGDSGRPLRPYPDQGYAQAAAAAEILLNELGPEAADLDDPELFRTFYRRLYGLADTGGKDNKLEQAVKRFDFPEVAVLYRLIEQDAVNVLVPYDKAAYDRLAAQARQEGLSRAWLARARRYAVSLFRPGEDSPVQQALEPIPLVGSRGGEMSHDWYICPAEGVYDPVLGFNPPKSWVGWVV